MNADFGDVNIHTGHEAVQMNQELGAKAFTHGKNIYFNKGQYQPHSTNGIRLLSHELTHVVQQNPNLSNDSQHLESSSPRIQRAYYFAPEKRVDGTLIHETVLPLFLGINDNLFIEVSIPGATAKKAHSPKTAGVADFYRPNPEGKQNTVGIKFVGRNPRHLNKNSRFRGRKGYDHLTQAAPLFREGKDDQILKRLTNAATLIEIGDLKPGGMPASVGRTQQIPNYQGGLRTTANKTNQFIHNPKNKGKVEALPDPKWNWDLTTGPLSGLDIPKKLKYPSGGGVGQSRELGVWLGNTRVVRNSSLKGSLYVYEGSGGIYIYEWFPDKMDPIGHSVTDAALNHLNTEIIPNIQTKPLSNRNSKFPKKKSSNLIQLKAKSFDHDVWKAKYAGWKSETEPILTDNSKIENEHFVSALVDLKNRSKYPVNLDEKTVIEKAKSFKKVRHWLRFGGKYGLMRKYFGNFFFKLGSFYQSIKERFSKLIDGVKQKSSGGKYTKGLSAKVFALLKKLSYNMLSKVLTHLRTAFTTGPKKVISNFFSSTNFGKWMEAKINAKNNAIDKIHRTIQSATDFKVVAKLKKASQLFKSTLANLSKVKSWFSKIDEAVKWTKRAVKIIQCATPPVVGCLKILLNGLLKLFGVDLIGKLIKRVMRTCLVQEEFILPAFNTLKQIQDIPLTLYKHITDPIKDSFPKELQPLISPLFPEPNISFKLKPKDLDACNKDDLTKADMEYARVAEKHGPEKLKLLIEYLEKMGVGEKSPLQSGHIKSIDEALTQLSKKQLEEALKNINDPNKKDVLKAVTTLKKVAKSIKSGASKQVKEYLFNNLKSTKLGFTLKVSDRANLSSIIDFLGDPKPGIIENQKIPMEVIIDKPEKYPKLKDKGFGANKNKFAWDNARFNIEKVSGDQDANDYEAISFFVIGRRNIRGPKGYMVDFNVIPNHFQPQVIFSWSATDKGN